MLRILISVVSNKLITWGIIPLCLFLLWVGLSIFVNPNTSFTILSYKESAYQISKENILLLHGKNLTGSFVARDNHLGIVSIKFVQSHSVAYDEEDVLQFKIKEKGVKDWYSVNQYRSGLIYGLNNFPFGFLPIENSKGKTYQFELTSLRGNRQNAVRINKNDFVLTTSYKYPKREIFGDKRTLIRYIWDKVTNTYLDNTSFLNSLIYLVPLEYYLLGLVVFETTKKISKSIYGKRIKNGKEYNFVKNKVKELFSIKYILETVAIILLLIDLSIIQGTYAGVILSVLGFWIAGLFLSRFTSSASFKLSACFIFLYVLLISSGLPFIAEKAAVWVYFFLVIGTIHAFVEVAVQHK